MISSSVLSQDLFVDSYFNGTVIQISPDGTQSTFASGIPTASGMAFDSAGNLFVAKLVAANGNYGSIVTIAPNGAQSTFAYGLNSPVSLAFSSAGNLFVDSYSAGTITEITPAGVQSTFASGLYSPEGIAFDSAGNLFVASGSIIYKFTPGGVRTTFASGLGAPYGIAIDHEDNVFAADGFSTTIDKFTPTGVRSTVGYGLVNVYNCMAIDSADNLFVGEWGTGNAYSGTIVKITPSGVQSIFSNGLYSPTAIAFQIPEPSALVLLIFGATMFVMYARHSSTPSSLTLSNFSVERMAAVGTSLQIRGSGPRRHRSPPRLVLCRAQ
jgi:sugar lactone lactonase YvrE